MTFSRDTSHSYFAKEFRLLRTQHNRITLEQSRREIEETVDLGIEGVRSAG